MSPFFIFAICLSIAYILYYGVNIGKDLYAAGKQPASNEEVFEIENSPTETAVSVNEQGDGFFIGNAEPKEPAKVFDPGKEEKGRNRRNRKTHRFAARESGRSGRGERIWHHCPGTP
ncbi:hypothetical protein [uncultured Bacteroides sp.]|uniref:hypothetical protein n=1 Tax=uncultured Bacteroides sp. TaxID=162156 RepID=UPI002608A738|nr:hypothetical protein [uncultured Bacteroides sp.]